MVQTPSEHPAVRKRRRLDVLFFILTFSLSFFNKKVFALGRRRSDTGFSGRPRRRQTMDTHFYLGLALVLAAFVLCFIYRKENRKK